MKIVYLSDSFHHHQKPLADALYQANKGEYCFVEMREVFSEYRKSLGFKEYKEPYLIKYSGNETKVDQLIMEADAVICGEAPSKLVKKRVNAGKITFRDDERRYKGIIKYLKYPIYTWHSLVFNKGYLLAASAYGSRDYVLSGMKSCKCFRWGYFTEVKEIKNIDAFIEQKQKNNVIKKEKEVSILWAGRLVGLKHPELAVEVARRLNEDGFKFHVNIIGPGEMTNKLKELIEKYNLSETVSMLGQKGQDEVRKYMEESEIFLFTSDEREGWGAVLNESMASACVPVASHAAGSSSFLIKNGENGFIFKSENIESLYAKVKQLVEDKALRIRLCKEAYLTMHNTWNGKKASENLMALIQALKEGKGTPITDGPGSQAPIMNHTWM